MRSLLDFLARIFGFRKKEETQPEKQEHNTESTECSVGDCEIVEIEEISDYNEENDFEI